MPKHLSLDSHYAFEIICTGPARHSICLTGNSSGEQNNIGNVSPSKNLVQDSNVRFVSENFAKFLNLFIDSGDKLGTIFLKISIIKSLLATYFVLVFLSYLSKYRKVRNQGLQIAVVLLSAPYFLQSISNIYPPGLTTLAFLVAVTSAFIFALNLELSSKDKVFLLMNFVLSTLVVLANRIETSIFLIIFLISMLLSIVCGLIGKVQSKFNLKAVINLIVIFFVVGTPIVLKTHIFKKRLLDLFLFRFTLIQEHDIEESAVLSKLGRTGFSLESGITLLDNLWRLLENSIPQTSGLDFRNVWNVWFLLLYIPFVVILGIVLFRTFAILLNRQKYSRADRFGQIPASIVIFLFVAIPFVAVSVWFLSYVYPLLVAFLLLAETPDISKKVLKFLLGMVIFTNTASIVLNNNSLENVYLENYVFNPLSVALLFVSLVCLLILLLPKFINGRI